MSDENKIEDPLHKQIEEEAKLEHKKKEVQAKELIVRERRADLTVQQILQGDKDAELARSVNYGSLSKEDILQIQNDNTEYMYAARNRMKFINNKFDKAVPFFRKNLIFVGAYSGYGKSTTTANIALGLIGSVNPITNKKRRVLIISNEECTEDVYNRITCLIKGWHYVSHDQFTEEQVKVFNTHIELLSRDGMITVIGKNHRGVNGTTSTLEGITQIFENLIANREYFDAIIIDYYQNINSSRANPLLENWKVQELLAAKLDGYKNTYPAPIVVLGQLNSSKEDSMFKERIVGRKSIFEVCTCVIEMVAHKEDLCTEWVFHKNRFNATSLDSGIDTGYKDGRFVEYSDEFKAKVNQMKADRDKAAQDKEIGFTGAIENEEKKDE